MKKGFTILIALFLAATSVFAQTKKYALLEHFTNTRCGICGQNNPSFFTRISVESNTNLHHISYHSLVPYVSCVFYQANKVPQDVRATYYNILGTPQVAVNGQTPLSTNDITPPIINENAGNNAIVSVKVTETTGTNRTATVKLKAFSNLTASTYRLFVAVVEKKVNYAAPNTERVHYNVFRKFINTSDGAGDVLSAITNGSETTLTFNYAVDATWAADQTYVVAWIQNPTTKEVLNSGTRFDPTTGTNEVSVDNLVAVSPNPMQSKTTFSFNNLTPQYLTVSNAAGQVVSTIKLSQSTTYELDLSQFAKGFYFAKIQTSEGVATKKVIKE